MKRVCSGRPAFCANSEAQAGHMKIRIKTRKAIMVTQGKKLLIFIF